MAVLDSSQSQYSKALKLSHPHPLTIYLLCPVSQPHPSLMSQPLPYHHPHQEIIKQRNHSVLRWVRLLAMQVRQKQLEQPRPQNRVFLLTLERRKVRAWCSLEWSLNLLKALLLHLQNQAVKRRKRKKNKKTSEFHSRVSSWHLLQRNSKTRLRR